MKRLVLLSVFLSIVLLARPQQKIEVETSVKNMSKGPQMALTIQIPEAKKKDVEFLWKRYVNNRSIGERVGNLATQFGNIFKNETNQISRDKLKVEKKDDELYVRSIEQSLITLHSMDIYAKTTELPESCQFSAFFQYTDSVFINETNVDQERILNMKAYIRDFGVVAYNSVVDEQIREAKKEVARQEGLLKDIESDTKKEEKSIAKYEVDIQEFQSGIAGLENDLKRLDEKTSVKKEAYSKLTKGTPDYDAAKVELKDLAKEKSKNFGKIKAFKSKIKSKEMDIKSTQNKVRANDLKVTKQLSVIEEKELVVEKLSLKKAGIL